MRNPWRQPVLLLTLVASMALAREREPAERTVILSEHPRDHAPRVYVAGRIATVLRFEKPCDPVRTKLLGWEGRFEPLVVSGKMVVLYPLRDLTPEDRLMLLVSHTDGTELSFIVTTSKQSLADRIDDVDQQVNVFADREGYDAVLSALYRALKVERALREENERLKQEENSADHALATLLANGHVKQTPFRRERKAFLKNEDMDIMIEVFSGPGKAAAVVHLTNTYNHEPWRFRDARLTSDLTSDMARPFALRMNRAEIVPGASGRIAVVADQSAFESKEGLVDLALEIFREDGLQQVVVRVEHTLIRR
jgi:uncharacterized protein (TIGR02268 family)